MVPSVLAPFLTMEFLCQVPETNSTLSQGIQQASVWMTGFMLFLCFYVRWSVRGSHKRKTQERHRERFIILISPRKGVTVYHAGSQGSQAEDMSEGKLRQQSLLRFLQER